MLGTTPDEGMAEMAITQEQADKFCVSLKDFYDSLGEDEKGVLDQILEQATPAQEPQGQAESGRPFFEKFLYLNPGAGKGTNLVTLKFPSDSDEPASPEY